MRKPTPARFRLHRPLFPYGGWFILDSLTSVWFGADGPLHQPKLGQGWLGKDEALGMLQTLLVCHRRHRRLDPRFKAAWAMWTAAHAAREAVAA